jgi:major intracellular serine protease
MSDYFLPPYVVHHVGSIDTLSQIYPQAVRDWNIPKIWKNTKGKGITVAILDTGIQLHKDLKDNILLDKCRSFVTGENIYDNSVFHGVHVSGIVGASDNFVGMVGIAPEVNLVSVKVLDKNGMGGSNIIRKGLEYCLELKPDIINMSLGSEVSMPDVYDVIKKLNDKNIIMVCAAGNNGENKILYPAQYDECIAVGSYNDIILRNRSKFSSWGSSLDILAPGENILSTYGNDTYALLSGSSMASPGISGIIALLLSYHKSLGETLTVDQVKNLLYENCIDLGDKGKDLQYGWGIIDPDKLFSASIQSLPRVVVKKETVFDKFKKLFKKLFKR